MDETFKAYVAGLFDGDGSVFARRQKYGSAGRHTIVLEVAFAMQSRETLEMLAREFGGTVTDTRAHRAFDYKLQRDKAYNLLKVIEPYVFAKRDQLKFAMFMFEQILSIRKPSQHHISEAEYAIREHAAEIMSLMNHRDSMYFHGKAGEFGERLKTLSTGLVSMLTPSQASEGKGSEEGVTTTEVSPNNNPPHERPTSH